MIASRDINSLQQQNNYGELIENQRNINYGEHIDHIEHQQQYNIHHSQNHYHIGDSVLQGLSRPLDPSSSSSSSSQLDTLIHATHLVLREISGVYSDTLEIHDIISSAQIKLQRTARHTLPILAAAQQLAEIVSKDLQAVKQDQEYAMILSQEILDSAISVEKGLGAFIEEFSAVPDLMFKAICKTKRSVQALDHRVEQSNMFAKVFRNIGLVVWGTAVASIPISGGSSLKAASELSTGGKIGLATLGLFPVIGSIWSRSAAIKFKGMIKQFEQKLEEIVIMYKDLDMQARLLSAINLKFKTAIEAQKRMHNVLKYPSRKSNPQVLQIEFNGNRPRSESFPYSIDDRTEFAILAWSEIANSLKFDCEAFVELLRKTVGQEFDSSDIIFAKQKTSIAESILKKDNLKI